MPAVAKPFDRSRMSSVTFKSSFMILLILCQSHLKSQSSLVYADSIQKHHRAVTSTDQNYPRCSVRVHRVKSRVLIYTSDTLNDEADAYNILEARYAELLSGIDSNARMSAKRLLFVYYLESCLIVEAAVELNNRPSRLSSGQRYRTLPAGKYLSAFFEGTYDRIVIAYDSHTEAMASKKLKPAGLLFEEFDAEPYNRSFPKVMKVKVSQRVR